MPTQNVNLNDQLAEFVKDCVKNGPYQNASEVVRAGLRLLKQQEEENRLKLEHLHAEIQKGLDDYYAGRTTVFNTREELDNFFADVKRRGRERLKKEANEATG